MVYLNKTSFPGRKKKLYRRRPVRRDRSIDPSMHSSRLLGFLEAPLGFQRVRLADGSHMLVRVCETPWRSRDDFPENFRPSRGLATHG